jgi:hypothetical protein
MQQDNTNGFEPPLLPIRGKAVLGRLLGCLGLHTSLPENAFAEYDRQGRSVRVFGQTQTAVAEITRQGHFRAAWFDHESSQVQFVIAAASGDLVQSFDQLFDDDLRPVGRPRNVIIFKAKENSREVRDLVLCCLRIANDHTANRTRFPFAPSSV